MIKWDLSQECVVGQDSQINQCNFPYEMTEEEKTNAHVNWYNKRI